MSICHLRWMICNNKVVDDMPLFERMICNFCEIDDIQCLRIDLKKPSPVGEGGPLAVDEVSGQGMPLGEFDEEEANTSSVILANARMPPSPTGEGLEYIPPSRMIIKRRESVLAQASERRLLLGALGEAEQSAKRKAQRCFAPKGVYPTTTLLMIYRFVETDDNQAKRVCACTSERVQIAPRCARRSRAEREAQSTKVLCTERSICRSYRMDDIPPTVDKKRCSLR